MSSIFDEGGQPDAVSLSDIRRRYEGVFERFFGVPLSQYWNDQLGGFQATAFHTQVFAYLKHSQVHHDCLAAMYRDIAEYHENALNLNR